MGPIEKLERDVFSRACCDRTRNNDFKLREGRFRLDTTKKFFTMRVVRQESCGCPLPGSVQGQVGWGFEQPGLAEDIMNNEMAHTGRR